MLFTPTAQKTFEFKDAVVFGFDTIRNDHSVKNREQEITIKFGNREQKWLVAVAFFNSLVFSKMLCRSDSSQTFNIAYYDGHEGVLSSKLFGNFNKFAAPLQPNVYGFTLTTTFKGFTQSAESKSARFTAAQKQLIKSAFENGSKIFIEDVHGQTVYGQTINFGSLDIQF